MQPWNKNTARRDERKKLTEEEKTERDRRWEKAFGRPVIREDDSCKDTLAERTRRFLEQQMENCCGKAQ